MSRWIRLNTDAFVSEWLFPLSAGARLAWVCLLLYCKAHGTGGRVKKMTPLLASRQWMVGEEDVTAMIAAATSHGAVALDGTEWVIEKWSSYQEPSTLRVQKHRKTVNETPCNKWNTTETETETETMTRTVFKTPALFEVAAYMEERLGENSDREAERFHDFYTSKGWMVGKNKMKDWKASVRNWLKDKPKDDAKPYKSV